MLDRLDFWLAVIVLSLAAWYELRLGRIFGPLARALGAVLTSSRPAAPVVQCVNNLPVFSEAFTAVERDVQGSNVQAEPPTLEPPTLAELRMLAQAVSHNARGQTKQASIEQAFGVKKAGSVGWRRASALFDEAMKEPEV